MRERVQTILRMVLLAGTNFSVLCTTQGQIQDIWNGGSKSGE